MIAACLLRCAWTMSLCPAHPHRLTPLCITLHRFIAQFVLYKSPYIHTYIHKHLAKVIHFCRCGLGHICYRIKPMNTTQSTGSRTKQGRSLPGLTFAIFVIYLSLLLLWIIRYSLVRWKDWIYIKGPNLQMHVWEIKTVLHMYVTPQRTYFSFHFAGTLACSIELNHTLQHNPMKDLRSVLENILKSSIEDCSIGAK